MAPTNSENSAGTSTNVNSVETISPPTTTEPRPLYNSLPAPVMRISGLMPHTLVRAVMKIGRMRVRTLSVMASRGANPPSRMLFSA